MTPIALRYQLGPDEYLAQQQSVIGDTSRRALRTVWKDTLLFVGACTFGFLAAFQANNRILMVLLGTAGLARVLTPWDHKIKLQAQIAAHAEKSVRRRDISLRIDDEGLHEEVEGVRSFAPWPTVKSFRKLGHILLIRLAGELWVVIPEVAFLGAGAPSQTEFIALLQSHGVANETA
ncbi:YcxB family protein [Duganella sp. Root198D2]|uniref:YcxB family protein n=1 Tax=Duganella sp. Root198D2 TaxID=1736489 RepID=UPI00070CB1FD|nr:YcxB family protein [Duganella sp. Root198D2]KRB83813.1 hypothetical protein ASE26_11705 [Duganella sp. Root198D2]